MQRKDTIRLWKPGKKSVPDHCHGTRAGFLGGLPDHDQGSLPFLPEAHQQARHADKDGHVDIMATGMHDAVFPIVRSPR